MNRRFSPLLTLVLLLVGGAAIAGIAYSAGAASTSNGATAPAWVYGAHFGWGLGFLFFPLLFILLLFLLFRALFWGFRSGPGGPGGWGQGPGYGPNGDWMSRREAAFHDLHRRAHEHAWDEPRTQEPGGQPPAGPAGSSGAPGR